MNVKETAIIRDIFHKHGLYMSGPFVSGTTIGYPIDTSGDVMTKKDAGWVYYKTETKEYQLSPRSGYFNIFLSIGQEIEKALNISLDLI